MLTRREMALRFGAMVKAARLAKGWSRKVLCLRLGRAGAGTGADGCVCEEAWDAGLGTPETEAGARHRVKKRDPSKWDGTAPRRTVTTALTRGALSLIERGERLPRWSTVDLFVRALQLDLDSLLLEAPPP